MPAAWVLRDYHSPNLLWLPEREGIARVGVIDFQDAMRGPAAYDLVSLLQDARVDVAPELEAAIVRTTTVPASRRAGRGSIVTLSPSPMPRSARSATPRSLGIFARLAKRDGKPRIPAVTFRGYGDTSIAISRIRSWPASSAGTTGTFPSKRAANLSPERGPRP